MVPNAATTMRRKGKTMTTVRIVQVTMRLNCRKFSMLNGRTASISSWSLLKRFTIRPVGVVSKKLMGLARI